jgi:hypothetical protein
VPEPTTNELQPPLPLAEKLGLETIPTRPLCHYTTQGGLIGILKDKAMWATDAAYLNDSQEVVYAVNLAKKYFRNRTPKDLRFEMEMRNILEQTEGLAGRLPAYVASFSEEPDLLSQWRGYCSEGPGFTLCVSAGRMMTLAGTHDWQFFKCIYDEDAQVEILKKMLGEAVDDPAYAQSFPTQVAFGLLLLYLATAFKHPKFKEESEWRAVKRTGGTPFVQPGAPVIPPKVRPGASTLTPYIPFPLTVKDEPVELVALVVGPTPHPSLAIRAAKGLLQERGIICPEPVSSEIPFRNW